MSQVDDAFFFAEPLSPDDRLRLIARLWASLPPDHWAAPSPTELAEVERRLAEHSAGQSADVPWEIVNRMLTNHEAVKVGKIYSAPRRFDLATILIVTAAYALVLAGFSSFRLPPIVSGYVAAFITCVGIGQALLFGGKRPRLASVLTGMATFFLCVLSLSFFERRFAARGPEDILVFGLVASVLYGGMLGYVAGVLVGGVFLIADVLRQRTSTQLGGSTTGSAVSTVATHASPSDESPENRPPLP